MPNSIELNIQLSIMYSSLAAAYKGRSPNEYHNAIAKAERHSQLLEKQLDGKQETHTTLVDRSQIQKTYVDKSNGNAIVTAEQINLMENFSIERMNRKSRSRSGVGLQPKVKEPLIAAGLTTVADLLRANYSTIKNIPGLSGSSYHHINKVLAIHGLHLDKWIELNRLAPGVRPLLKVTLEDLPQAFIKERGITSTLIDPLPIRIRNCLNAIDVITLEDLLTRSVNDLRHIPNLGEKSIHVIVEWLSQMKLTLGVTHW